MKHKTGSSRILPLLLLAVLLFLLCSRFSYFADDWFWGTDGHLSTFFDSFSNPDNPFHFYNNGRYFGNGLGFIAANHKLIRDLIMTAVLWTILVTIANISLRISDPEKADSGSAGNLMIFLSGTVLLLCPREMFRESIGWSVAFMIYVVPSALYLTGLKKIFGQKEGAGTDILFFLLPLLSAFFIENLTIGNAIFTVFWLLYRFVSKRRPAVNEWLWLAGSLLGLILMMSDDGYSRILEGNAEETYWGAQTGSLFLMIGTGLKAFRNFIADAIAGWVTLLTVFGAINLLTACLLMRGGSGGKSNAALLLSLGDVLIAVCFIFRRVFSSREVFFDQTRTAAAVLTALFLISQPVIIFLLPYSKKQKEVMLFTWLFAAFITLPLLVAEPLSMRVFFPTYVFLLLLYSQIACINLKEISTRYPRRTLKKPLFFSAGIFLTAWGYLFGIYAVIDHYEQERIKYVRYQESLGIYDTLFPTLPLADRVVVSYPWENTWQERYKKFFDLNLDMRFTIVSFEEWKAQL